MISPDVIERYGQFQQGIYDLAGLLDILAVLLLFANLLLVRARELWRRYRVRDGYAPTLYETLVNGVMPGLTALIFSGIVKTAAALPDPSAVINVLLLVALRLALTWSLMLERDGRLPWGPRPTTTTTSEPIPDNADTVKIER